MILLNAYIIIIINIRIPTIPVILIRNIFFDLYRKVNNITMALTVSNDYTDI